jgi:hypothetical protein
MTDPTQLYHCGDPSTMEENTQAFWCEYTMCGLPIQRGPGEQRVIAWNFPNVFVEPFEKWDDVSERCPECMNHPDMPLMLLGELA